MRAVPLALGALVLAVSTAWAQPARDSANIPSGRPVSIKTRAVLDGKGGTLNDVVIVVQGSKIVRIEPARGDATYDLTTQTVLPGLIDTHTHIVDHFDRTKGRLRTAAASNVRRGFVSVRTNRLRRK